MRLKLPPTADNLLQLSNAGRNGKEKPAPNEIRSGLGFLFS